MANISLTIDDKIVEVAENTTVLEAAQLTGIYIPTLCYHPSLKTYEGCRLCLVDIQGIEEPVASCVTPAAGGMVVRTDTPEVKKSRRDNLESILVGHPNWCLTCDRRERCSPFDVCLRTVSVTERCVTCPKNGHCELQRIVDYIGIDKITIPYEPKELPLYDDPLIRRDYNLCIQCGRCVRMCDDARGIGAIGFIEQEGEKRVGAVLGGSLKDSGCRFCGACVEVCHTGALTDREALWSFDKGHEEVAVPCHYACPAGMNVPLYVYLVGEGKYQDAIAVIREKVPFPGVLGRVCIHPCEQACRRNELDKPISIKELKRFAADRDSGDWKQFSIKLPPTGKKVAIVGSGPAGLTAAYYLAKLGHSAIVFESLSRPGGMMRVGIPDYRLPKEVLDGEIDVILQAGVELQLNTRVESVDKLLEEGYDAVSLAVGAHLGTTMRIPGENNLGVVDGAAFLRKISLGEKMDVGDTVAVVGGGNVAIDGARVALRLGARKVKMFYRRTRDEMPASPEEVEAALEEDIDINFLTNPVGIVEKDGKLQVTCVRNELGEPDASGRRRPVPISGSEFVVELDTLVMAIGQVPDIPEGFNVKTGRGNTIQVVPGSMATSRDGVWAGGDVASGPASVIGAIEAGRKAAVSIDKYLGGKGIIDEELTQERQIGMCVGKDSDFASRERVKMPCLTVSQRTGNFKEVELGLGEKEAVAEGKRCFQCGVRLQIPQAPKPPLEGWSRTKRLGEVSEEIASLT